MDGNIHHDMNRLMHVDNRSLVEECLKGDREALSLFYTRFAPKMLALIRRYVSDPMDAGWGFCVWERKFSCPH